MLAVVHCQFGRENRPMLMDSVRNRVKQVRKALGITLEELEEKTGISNGYLSRIERGERKLSFEALETIAQGLGVDPTMLIVDVDSFETVEVRAAVQGGLWVDKTFWDPERCYTIAIPRDPRYEAGSRFGAEVKGTASNLRYKDGTIVVCVSVPSGFIPEEPDVRFLVERRQGPLVELTVRKFSVDSRGGRWLVAETDDFEFQQPVPYEDLLTQQAKILARVVGSYVPE